MSFTNTVEKLVFTKKKYTLFANVLLMCFILQQLGFNYHLSFATIGIVLIFKILAQELGNEDFKNGLYVSLSILFCLLINLVEGYNDEFFRVLRFSLNGFILFFLLNKNYCLPIPSKNFMFLVIFFLVFIVSYQVFVDPYFQIDQNFFSTKENLGIVENEINNRTIILRTNGIFSEPSYLGMVLCCIFSLIINSNNTDKFIKILQSILLIFTLIISGSGLGLAGLILLSIDYLLRMKLKKTILFFIMLSIILITIISILDSSTNLTFSILERILTVKTDGDASGETRFLHPFNLIYYNFYNGRIFGSLFDNYQFFLNTNLYTDPSDFPMHNGILNLIILFGIFGIWYIFKIIYKLNSSTEIILFLIVGMQNGNFFSYEKVFALVYILFTLRSFINTNPQRI